MGRGQGINLGIFWAVFLALLAFGGIVFSVQLYREHLAAVAVQEAIQSWARSTQAAAKSVADRRRRADARRRTRQRQQLLAQRKRQQCDMESRARASNQRCMGGSSIEQEGHTYTQVLGSDGAPIGCEGRYATEAFRAVPGCS